MQKVKDYIAAMVFYTIVALLFFVEGCLFLWQPGQQIIVIDTWQRLLVPAGVSLLGVLLTLLGPVWVRHTAPPPKKWWHGLYNEIKTDGPFRNALVSTFAVATITGVLANIAVRFGAIWIAIPLTIASVLSLLTVVCIVHLNGGHPHKGKLRKAKAKQ